MTEKGRGVLARSKFPKVFTTGGCHVFALAIQAAYADYQLVKVQEGENAFAHIACNPEGGMLLDAYGWISIQAYQDDRGKPILVTPTTESEMRAYTGYCWDEDFVEIVAREARRR